MREAPLRAAFFLPMCRRLGYSKGAHRNMTSSRRCWGMKMSVIFAALFAVGLCSQASAGIFGPNSYEECIEESLKGVSSDVAARALIINCRKKFPTEKERKKIEYDKYIENNKRSAHRLYDYDAIRDVSGNASVSIACNDGCKNCILSGHMTNMSKEFYITSFVIELRGEGGAVVRTVIVDNAPPGSTVKFIKVRGDCDKDLETFSHGTFSWNIIEYTGFSMTGAPPMP